ncbi:hypothetical protein PM082_000366 [Marasmius tenuissimus]|nr:hypothetical protein PM082_000366 [Marasmius tenuissimus]
MDKSQNAALDLLYNQGATTSLDYDVQDVDLQQQAYQKLTELGLDVVSRQALESRWSVQYSDSWTTAKETKRRTIYQCACGCDSSYRSKSKNTANSTTRRIPYQFTGCLAHVEVVESIGNGKISRISGYLEHNAGCHSAVLERIPPIPLHEHVYEIALGQLRNGANLTAMQELNRTMIERQEYRGMKDADPSTQNFRYVLRTSDHNTLYRKFSRELGVDVRVPPQYNVDDWLNPSSPRYRKEFADAVFHYSARASADERFEICISTKDMDEQAWKFVHHNQLVLDGTFGICTSRLLLFIALGVDDQKKGLPVALFLFSAPTGNKASHAGYNTEILRKLLLNWRLHLERIRPSQSFIPHSAITDTDTKERGALLRVWPSIILLLCKFHVRQCWTNHRKALGSGKKDDSVTAPVGDSAFWKESIRDQIRALEVQLISTTEHHVAVDLVNQLQLYLTSLLANPSAKTAATSGINHIKYLNANWMSLEMWQSWSERGRIAAAAMIGVSVEGVVPTTNHLESLNGVLKKKHIKAWMHSGHRLRFDFLIYIVVMKILPAIYSSYNIQKNYSQWLTARFSHSSGGVNLVEAQRLARADQIAAKKTASKRCWWTPDASRDQEASLIVHGQRISVGRADVNTFQATCLSSRVSTVGTTYSIFLSRSGAGECSCLDFQSRGGACKHLRALRILIDSWVAQGLEKPPFYYPSCLEDAKPCEFLHPPPNIDLNTAELLPTIIAQAQSIGGDSTTLSLDEPDELDDKDGDDCVEEREREDLESNNSEESASPLCLTTIPASQAEGIRQQLSIRIKHEVKQVLPRLHGLLTNVSELSDIPGSQTSYQGDDEVEEFKILMGQLVDGFSSLSIPLRGSKDLSISALMGDRPTAIPYTPTPETTASVTRRRHAHNPSLRPPSPENRQHRHNSNVYMP